MLSSGSFRCSTAGRTTSTMWSPPWVTLEGVQYSDQPAFTADVTPPVILAIRAETLGGSQTRKAYSRNLELFGIIGVRL